MTGWPYCPCCVIRTAINPMIKLKLHVLRRPCRIYHFRRGGNPFRPLSFRPSSFSCPFHSLPLRSRSRLNPSWESGERCKLPQSGLGKSPCKKLEIVAFVLNLTSDGNIENQPTKCCFVRTVKAKKIFPSHQEGGGCHRALIYDNICPINISAMQSNAFAFV